MRMKLSLALLPILLFSACQSSEMQAVEQPKTQNSTTMFKAAIATGSGSTAPSDNNEQTSNAHHHGVVEEVLEDGKYLIIKVNEQGQGSWLVARAEGIAAGDHIDFHTGLRKTGYYNAGLDRTFEEVFLVSSLTLAHRANEAATAHGASNTASAPASATTPAAQVKDALSVADFLNQAASLAGQTVRVRGTVTKVNANIMNTHWIHLATNAQSGDDLVVTTQTLVPVGHEVVFEGTVVLDKNLGAGYSFAVLLENAQPL